jgi:hypothetical protein
MLIKNYTEQAVLLFNLNKKNYSKEDTETLCFDINKNNLNISSFEEMFNLMCKNIEKVTKADYELMYDLFYNKLDKHYFEGGNFIFKKN